MSSLGDIKVIKNVRVINFGKLDNGALETDGHTFSDFVAACVLAYP